MFSFHLSLCSFFSGQIDHFITSIKNLLATIDVWLFCIGWVIYSQWFYFWKSIWFCLHFLQISVLLWWEIKKSWKENHVKIFHCAKDPTYTYKILTVQLKKTIRAIKLPLKTESVTAMLYVAAGWASCYSWPVSASF